MILKSVNPVLFVNLRAWPKLNTGKGFVAMGYHMLTEPEPNGSGSVYYFNLSAFTPSLVIFTGTINPSSSKCISSMHTTLLLAAVSVSGRL